MTFLVFPLHRPWWAYYYIHNSIPLCWCAGIATALLVRRCVASLNNLSLRDLSRLGIGERNSPKAKAHLGPNERGRVSHWAGVRVATLNALANKRRYRLVATSIVVCVLILSSWIAMRVYLQIADIRAGQRLDSCMVLKEIDRFKPYTKFLFAFDPIYSFHSGIPMPPHLAVISLKRLWSGEMTNERLTSEVTETKPELILLPNNGTAVPYQALIDREYKLVYHDDRTRLFAHRDISKRPYEAPVAN